MRQWHLLDNFRQNIKNQPNFFIICRTHDTVCFFGDAWMFHQQAFFAVCAVVREIFDLLHFHLILFLFSRCLSVAFLHCLYAHSIFLCPFVGLISETENE